MLSDMRRGQSRADMIWESLAYAARYGMQPLPVLLAMTMRDVHRFNQELSTIVKQENKKPSS